jgi:hypothetical protein
MDHPLSRFAVEAATFRMELKRRSGRVLVLTRPPLATRTGYLRNGAHDRHDSYHKILRSILCVRKQTSAGRVL